MTLILLYLVVLVLVATVLFGVGSVVFGRGERLPPLPRATTATVLPASEVTGADVDALRFTQTLRGYKASEVDWVLERLGQELDQLRGQLAAVRAAYGIDDFVPDSDGGSDAEFDTEFDAETNGDPGDVPEDAAHPRGVPALPADGRDEQ
ncbi:MAG: DivIVA domain-containing protein [Mycobacterium sp.]